MISGFYQFKGGVCSAEDEGGEGGGGPDHGGAAEERQEAVQARGRVQEDDVGERYCRNSNCLKGVKLSEYNKTLFRKSILQYTYPARTPPRN